MKKFRLLLFFVIAILTLFCFSACLDKNNEKENYQPESEEKGTEGLNFFPLDDGTYAVEVGNAKYLSKIVIPSTYQGKPVSYIGKNAFSNCTDLTSITIPDSVTSIGDFAFSNCPIETATIPAMACSYVRNIALRTVVITSGTSIGYDAFSSCTGLTSVTIGNSVTSIGEWAFSNCRGLTSVTYNGTKAQWNAISKGYNWNQYYNGNYNTIPFTVTCTDGSISY